MTEMSDLPIACSLNPDDLARRRGSLLPGLVAFATSSEMLADGMRWHFAPDETLLGRIAAVIDAERRCCRFLRFDLVVQPDEGPIVLTASGPPGTAEFLDSLTVNQ